MAVRRAPEELSATELRIAQLAADGLSNQAIAEQVFVSVKDRRVEPGARVPQARHHLASAARARARP